MRIATASRRRRRGIGITRSLVAGGLGLVAGAVIYGLVYDRVMPELLHVEPWLFVLVFAEATLLLFALTRHVPAR